MKNNKFIILSALLALSAATPAEAQIDAADSAQVNVAFRKVAKEDIMGGVSSINYRELMDKNYNTYSLDNLQGYVAGYNGNGMWGFTDQLVLIDGVPREANNVLPSEIEEITFLKGAQAVVLYGSRAAKGAVLITTKRGRVNDGLSVEVRANTGWNVAKSFPEYLGAAEYMTLYNEALVNDGNARKYSDEAAVAEAAKGAGFDPYEKKLLGITAMTALMGKKKFEEVLGSYITKPQGKPALVPESDKRPAINTAYEDFSEN